MRAYRYIPTFVFGEQEIEVRVVARASQAIAAGKGKKPRQRAYEV